MYLLTHVTFSLNLLPLLVIEIPGVRWVDPATMSRPTIATVGEGIFCEGLENQAKFRKTREL